MADPQRDSFVFYDDPPRGRRRLAAGSGWPVVAVMVIGAILILGNLAGLLVRSHMDTFGSTTGNGFAGTEIVGLVLGIGLVMRKELTRRVYLVFAVIGLVLTVVSSSSYSGSFASYILGIGVTRDSAEVLVSRRVRRAVVGDRDVGPCWATSAERESRPTRCTARSLRPATRVARS